MATIFKHETKSGWTYAARPQINGKRKFYNLQTQNKVIAQERLKRIEARMTLGKESSDEGPQLITVLEAYQDHAKQYYHGTSSVMAVHSMIVHLEPMYAMRINDLRPSDIIDWRDTLIAKGLCRSTINLYHGYFNKLIDWAIERGIANPNAVMGLKAVRKLHANRSAAKEPRKVLPAKDEDIAAIKQHCSDLLKDIIDLQLLTCARPGEILNLRGCDVDTSGPVWIARLEQHKTSHIGKTRTLYIGPKAQEVLQRRLDKVGQWTAIGEGMDVCAYRCAIKYLCRKHGIPHWHPHQLRHTGLTKLRAMTESHDAYQAVAGHSSLNTTQIYAELDAQKAIELLLQHG